jgi:propanediol dehydratase large subunit
MLFLALLSALNTFPESHFQAISTNQFESPSENYNRAPCPGLNTLANHGYLNRNGLNISDSELIDAFLNVYGIGQDASNTFLGAIKDLKNAYGLLDLNVLRQHNLLEHDVSLVHSDAFFSPSWIVNQTLVFNY